MKKIRSGGIILPVFSLPSNYGIGDLGPAAYRFADFLAEAGILYWQILPVNYTDAGTGHSPYSSLSAFAGNTLLISPELLVSEHLLQKEDLIPEKFRATHIEYEKVLKYKVRLFDKAFLKFNENKSKAYSSFCLKHSWWLEDFARYKVLKDHFGNISWADWPEDIRDRDPAALKKYDAELSEKIEKEKFLQYIFYLQWNKLKEYCQQRNIHFIGDMPFYVSYDSVDVWSYPEYFKLEQNKKARFVGGTPPDEFSDTGQLWGMPAYDWDKLERDGYYWWLKRVEHNLAICSILRLDHFRAFAACWEVPAHDKTAENGAWIKAPGDNFFKVLKAQFPELPFIAEDLGTIDQPVYDLRDCYQIPGMKVLQFAFSGDPANIFLPYYHTENSIVYTGTHDNNTTRGWYETLNKKGKKQLSRFLNKKIKHSKAHKDLIRLALQSVARVAIFPIQDILGLGAEAVINKPSTSEGNWTWRLKGNELTCRTSEKVKKMLYLSDRLTGFFK